MPSYGPGEDFGKESRWFGKTTEEIRQRELAEVAREARTKKREYPGRSGKSGRLPSWLIPAVVIVLLVMFGTVVWALWGSDITDFFSTTSTSPPTGVSELSPEEAATPLDTSSGVIIPSSGDGVSVFDSKQPPYSKTFGIPIRLTNNSSATEPTWQQLMSFLVADKTDQKDYSVFSFPCGAFAEEVHNNAEAAGIRAAWVYVDFEDNTEGHALNAFNTPDKGLVFVDCTSSYRSDIVYPLVFDPTTGESKAWTPERPSSCDKIAYVVVGKEYGQVSLDVATSPQYSVYEDYLTKREEYERKVEAYNQRVEAYSQEVEAYNQKANAYTQEVEAYNRELEAYTQALGGREYLEEPEYSQFMEWAARLDSMLAELEAMKAELGLDSTLTDLETKRVELDSALAELEAMSEEIGDFRWDSLGVISNIEIYW